MLQHDRPDDSFAEVGEHIGPYVLEVLLGEGAMGRVFRARGPDGQAVALKVLKPKLAADEQYSRRFRREVRAATQVEHRHLVGVIDFGEAGERYYLAMRYIAGGSLSDRLQAGRPLPTDDVLRIAAGVGAGLDALHDGTLVHRDVKVANIMLDEDGTALLTDFGLAKGDGYSVLSAPGRIIGTLDYLAPELIRGEPASPGSDIYALGCVVFECLSGHPPFLGRGMFDTGMAILNDQPSDPCANRPEAGSGFSEMVLSALAKAPEDRPPTATAYAHLLQAAAASRSG